MYLIVFEEKAEVQDQYPLSLNPVLKADNPTEDRKKSIRPMPMVHNDPESNRLVQKAQISKSLYRKIALITFVKDFLEHKKLIFFIP